MRRPRELDAAVAAYDPSRPDTVAQLVDAAIFHARRRGLVTVTCRDCRDRRIRGSVTLETLDAGGSRPEVIKALLKFHRLAGVDGLLDLVTKWFFVPDGDVSLAAVTQAGRWLHLRNVRRELGLLACMSKHNVVRILATQLLEACGADGLVQSSIAVHPGLRRWLAGQAWGEEPGSPQWLPLWLATYPDWLRTRRAPVRPPLRTGPHRDVRCNAPYAGRAADIQDDEF